MDYIPGLAAQHLTVGFAVIVVSLATEHEAFKLCNHGAVLKANQANFNSSTRDIAHALQCQVRIPICNLRVMKHHPEDCFSYFDYSEYRDAAVEVDVVQVDEVEFTLLTWNVDMQA
ncbi:hypothetical protein E2562_001514 [Oryza meyeriana var. granulata]|uniref:Uncharacterized protein n=1 Tax=Oryza meyeriana var. granulata TaxID=110450 RepID=A0A6G1DDT2_9ORYZ|nr:hypothetical protein E2562_001514 [Oryza meyeriana var. granulata]